MERFIFWSDWPKRHKLLMQFLLVLFLIFIMIFGAAYSRGYQAVIPWEVVSQSEVVEVPVDVIEKGLFKLPVNADNNVLVDYFAGGRINIDLVVPHLFLTALALGLIIILSVVTVFNRFWFLISMGMVSLALLTLNFDLLGIFGRTDRTGLVVVLLAYLPTAYFFHAIQPRFKFEARMFAFALITMVLGSLVYGYSTVDYPFLYLANYGLYAPFILSAIFIMMIAHEIMYGFLYLITKFNTERSSNTINHFVIVSILYLGNVFLLFLHRGGVIDWDFIYLDPFLLFMISLVLGLWGFKKRELLYENMVAFRPYGAALYVGLGIICLATISYSLAMGNDPLVFAFGDVIVYSHFGFGLIFFIYIVSNFYGLLKENQKVYKVAFKPRAMPFSAARIAGFVILLALFLKDGMITMSKVVSGVAIGVADIFIQENRITLAEEYLSQNSLILYPSHRASYMLAQIAEDKNRKASASSRYENIMYMYPSEYAYVNLSNLYRRNDLYFDALFTLQEGIRKFPKSGPIKNNLAMLFGQTNVIDSAFYYLHQTLDVEMVERHAQSNMAALLAQKKVHLDPDSLVRVYQQSDYLPQKVNLLAWFNRYQYRLQDTLQTDYFDRFLLNDYTAAYLYNFMFNQVGKGDSASVSRLINYSSHPGNVNYQQAMHFAAAVKAYYTNDIERAFLIIDRLQQTYHQYEGFYNHLRGLWALDQRAHRLAVEFFSRSLEAGYHAAYFDLAVAQTEAGLKEQAIVSWNSPQVVEQVIARGKQILMDEVLQARDVTRVLEESDEFKYHYLRYRYEELTDLEKKRIVNAINNKELKFDALLMMHDKHVFYSPSKEDVQMAGQWVQMASALDLRSKPATYHLRWAEMKNLFMKGEYQELQNRLKAVEPQDRKSQMWAYLFRAKIAEHVLNNDQKAQNLYQNDVSSFILFDIGILHAAQFLVDQQKSDQAYNLLLNGIRLNPYAVEVYQAYVILSLELRLFNFAESGMERLRELLSPREFDRFKAVYEEKLRQVQAEGEVWD
jgi:hypothetical protein